VRDEHDPQPLLAKPSQDGEQLAHLAGVEAARRLVEDQ
jgi:hypothetical protein